jgi:ribosomal-protein-alanine N-acetyltransferase
MKAPERFETQRLVLKRPRSQDAEAIFFRYSSDPDVTRFLSWSRHESVEATHAFLRFSDDEWAQWPAGPYLIESRESGQLLGGTGFGFETAWRATTGYVLAADSWGKGYATEALQAVVGIAREIGVIRLQALCHVGHPASTRVLEKCGFTREGVLQQHSVFPNLARAQPCDVFSYALILACKSSPMDEA